MWRKEHLLGSVYGGVWRSLRLAAVWSQAGVLCWCFWQEFTFSRCEGVFTFKLLLRNFINVVFLMQFTKIMLQ
jgi:hypothetical protein